MTLSAEFTSKTRPADCIVWTGAVNTKGYACFAIDGKSELAHRLAYEDAYGPIPDGMTIDHRCRVRSCVKPEHLEVVTIAENNRRKKTAGGLAIGSTCTAGHPITAETIYFHPRGVTECRECRRRHKVKTRAARAVA